MFASWLFIFITSLASDVVSAVYYRAMSRRQKPVASFFSGLTSFVNAFLLGTIVSRHGTAGLLFGGSAMFVGDSLGTLITLTLEDRWEAARARTTTEEPAVIPSVVEPALLQAMVDEALAARGIVAPRPIRGPGRDGALVPAEPRTPTQPRTATVEPVRRPASPQVLVA